MLKHNRWMAVGASGLLLAALPAPAQQKAKPKVTLEEAVIHNTGSTNTQSYRIILDRMSKGAGAAEVQYPGSTTDGSGDFLPLELNNKFFHDLHAAMPLKTLPARHGMRSVSFGTTTYITYKGQTSPDLTLPGNDKAQALHDDVQAIAKVLHVGGLRRPVLRPLAP